MEYVIKNRYKKYLMNLVDLLGKTIVTRSKNYVGTEAKKILVIRLDHIGDVLMTTPFIKSLKKNFPNASTTVVIKDQTFDIVRHNPYIDKIKVYNAWWTIGKNERVMKNGIVDFTNFVMELKREEYDLGFDLRGDFRNIMMMYLAGAKRRIGYANKGGGFMLTDSFDYGRDEHEIDKNIGLLRVINMRDTYQEPEIFVSEEDEKRAEDILGRMAIREGKITIGVHAGGASFYKRWPPEKFIELIKLLKKDRDTQILMFGAQNERDIVEKIMENVEGNGIYVMPELTLCQMAAVFRKCRLLICNDSGPMHVGIATRTPVVAIFGPSYPSRFGPKDLEMNRVVKPPIGCSPCWHPDNNIGCKDRKCLKSITAEQVFKAVKELVRS